jgi:hypothetical protein
MTKHTFAIDDANLKAVRDHINGEFGMKSWWPTEGPLQAKEEFAAAEESPEALAAWCDKWLDGSQWKQLKKAVDKASSSTAIG